MKGLPSFITLLVFVLVFCSVAAHNVSACSCPTYGEPRHDAKEYYGKKFKGAIFTGTIKEIIHDPKSEDGGITFSQLRIEVNKYWRGVNKPVVTILAVGPNTSCWFDWKLGQTDFFIAAKEGAHLYYSYCDLANWGGSYPNRVWLDYTNKILGRPKSFTRKK